ncbi:hypothetical protein Dimus_012325 [Dionaea muscipula]
MSYSYSSIFPLLYITWISSLLLVYVHGALPRKAWFMYLHGSWFYQHNDVCMHACMHAYSSSRGRIGGWNNFALYIEWIVSAGPEELQRVNQLTRVRLKKHYVWCSAN